MRAYASLASVCTVARKPFPGPGEPVAADFVVGHAEEDDDGAAESAGSSLSRYGRSRAATGVALAIRAVGDGRQWGGFSDVASIIDPILLVRDALR